MRGSEIQAARLGGGGRKVGARASDRMAEGSGSEAVEETDQLRQLPRITIKSIGCASLGLRMENAAC